MTDFLLYLGTLYQAWHAAYNAGSWFFNLDMEARQNYLESLLVINGLLPKE